MTDTPAKAEPAPPIPEAPIPGPPIPGPRSFETAHAGHFHGTEIAYRCIAGELHVTDAAGEPRASIFSFSYLADAEAPHSRPVTFAFNGGPGSASLWLHMGALGPRIIRVGDAAAAGAGPVAVEENKLCPLDVTDLVFIDPPGTGYSRMIGTAKPEDGWGLEQDAELVAGFIKAWLTKHRRWASPRFLCGESYGTTRAVAVAGKLSGGLAGVAFNGIALISMILDFHTARFEKGNAVPDVCYLPTYALTALFHGKLDFPVEDRWAFVEGVRRFATEDYLPALFAGSRLGEERRGAVQAKLAALTGLSPQWLARTRLRIDPARFRKELLRDEGKTVGRFDSRYTGTDYDEVGEFPDADPSSYAIDSAFVTAVNDHLTRVLQIDWPRGYTAFNREALQKWDWVGPKTNETPRWPGYVNVAPTLGKLLRENPSLRVLVANGLYDFATPFFAAESTIAGNGIDASRVRMTYYDAGHMMYLHPPSLAALAEDLRGLIVG
jgi:carboxypeptidase C (cathepsin A)